MGTGILDLKTDWGPFSQTYLGISRILNAAQGSTADIALFTGRTKPATVILPDTIFDYVQNVKSGDRRANVRAMPEGVSSDYSSYALRYFLDSKGDSALARFTVEHNGRVRCEITFENSSDEEREYFYGLGLAVGDPRKKVGLKTALRPWWIAGRDYTEIEAYQKTFGLGCRQCLTRIFSFSVENEVLAQAFGGWVGDRVKYRKTLPKPLKDGYVYLRYIKYGVVGQSWELRINGRATTFPMPQTWVIPGGGWGKNRDAYEEWKLLRIPVGCVPETELTVELQPVDAPSNDTARIWFDGMLFSEGHLPGDESAGNLLTTALSDEPLRESARVELESAAGQDSKFRIIIQDEAVRHATVATGKLRSISESGLGSFLGHLRKRYKLKSPQIERDSTVFPWGAVNIEPFTVPPHSEQTVSFTVAFDGVKDGVSIKAGKKAPPCDIVPQDMPYSEMISRLRDILLYNVNYPLQLSKIQSPFYVPAKYFPIPYSWDGGIEAAGMASFAPDLALQQASYFFADEEYDFPALFCGSPVPTSLYALWAVFQEKKDISVLSRSYAGAKRMYDFYLGRTPGSIVNAHNDGLLSTYPYCYNLGVDDHPIQRWAEECQLTKKGLYSIILMAQILRISRIMRNIAHLLGIEADAEQCRKDAELLANIIDGQMWDEESGLYGWLCRTENGVEPVVMRGCAGDRSGFAFLPLFAGQTVHKERLIKQMMDPSRFNTQFGISSVDMQAAYYNPNGYWNGGIWPVLQWYLWRGLLETGEPVLARKVAETILGTWDRCFKKEHYLGEHFMIASAQMNGAPNFGGLSAILIPMHAAYFWKYRITSCYDVIVLNQSADHAHDTLTFRISAPFLSSTTHNLLVNMGNGKTQYDLLVNGKPYGNFISDEYGHLSMRLPRPQGVDEMSVKPAETSPEKKDAQ
ncbi:MAG: trehalase family glycosidase [Victivallales bacterium]|jgi:hypothetical protein